MNKEAKRTLRKIINGATREKRRFQPYAWNEVKALPKCKPLISEFLDQGALSVAYGKPGSGKTFFAINVAMHIALGRPWHGLETKAGNVYYIAAEAGVGIRDRLKALELHYGLEPCANFNLITEPVDLCTSNADTKNIIEEIKRLELKTGVPVHLVIIDTLNRAMAGGNENSSDSMGNFIRNCDQIKMATKAHVMIIHHSGKDSDRGARGHSSLMAAVDTGLEVSQTENYVVVNVRKQREKDTGRKFSFLREVVEIGTNKTSCVLIPTDNVPAKNDLNGKPAIAYEILQRVIAQADSKSISREHLFECFQVEAYKNGGKPETIEKAFSRAIKEMKVRKLIQVSGKTIRLPDVRQEEDD